MNTPEDFKIFKYTWHNTETGKVLDCHQDVNLRYRYLTELPFQFGIVDGDFTCNCNELLSLKNSPEIVKGGFYCAYNKIISLEFGPKIVMGNFDCHNNQLVTLNYSPIISKGNFDCRYNKLPEDENTYKKYIRKLKLQKILEIC